VSVAPVVTLATQHSTPVVRNRVLCVLVLAALVAALGLAFVSVAPNRLVSGIGVPLHRLTTSGGALLALPAALLMLGVFAPATRLTHTTVAVAASLLLAGLAWMAGREASAQASPLSSLARVSFGGGFWLIALLVWLAAADALQRLGLPPTWHSIAQAALWLPLVALLLSGGLNALSLLKEHANREAFMPCRRSPCSPC
jgi:osmoprotectant transport system permease protein